MRSWPKLRPVFEQHLGPVDVRFTTAPNHATQLTREALSDGADLVVGMGGDGTLNEVVNGFLADGKAVSADAALALCPLGTGGDFRRTAAIPASPREAIAAIAQRPLRRVDACRVLLRGYDGATVERYFINTTSFGMGGEVAVTAKNNFLTRHSGKGAFLWATISSFLSYGAKQVQLEFDSVEEEPVRIMEVALGNGAYQGGGMMICPLAKLDSGSMEISVVTEIGIFGFLAALPYLYSGKAYSHPKCRHYRALHVKADSTELVAVEIDGEAIGSLPLEAKILPSAIAFAGIGDAG